MAPLNDQERGERRRLDLFDELRFQLHRANAFDLTIDIMVGTGADTDVFDFGANFQRG